MTRYGRLGLRIAALVLAVDLSSKYLILYLIELPERQSIRLAPFLDLSMVWNRGISYGWFQAENETGRWLLAAVTVAICAGLIWWLARLTHLLAGLAVGTILGGALGNLHDRVVYGAVVDFFDFHILGYHWYVFNVADAAISIGAALLVLDAFRPEPQQNG